MIDVLELLIKFYVNLTQSKTLAANTITIMSVQLGLQISKNDKNFHY